MQRTDPIWVLHLVHAILTCLRLELAAHVAQLLQTGFCSRGLLEGENVGQHVDPARRTSPFRDIARRSGHVRGESKLTSRSDSWHTTTPCIRGR
eukprot:7385831-Prymnesium_polylepis.9